MLYAQFLAWW